MQKVYEGNLVEIFRVSPNLYFRRADLPTRNQCNSAFLVGETAVAVVDVPSLEAAHELMDEAKLLFDKPIRYILLTHGHGDHVDGLPAFLDQDVTVFCSRRLLPLLVPAGSHFRATFAGVEGNMPLCLPGGVKAELFTLPDVTHSPWDMFIHLPDEQLLCTGDAAVEFQTLYYHSASVETWIASLRKLSAKDDKYILPGHGEIYPYAHIGEVADFIATVLRAAQHCFDQLSAEEISNISAGKINSAVSAYFSGGHEDTLAITQKAGGDAQREVRMVLWHLICAEMR